MRKEDRSLESFSEVPRGERRRVAILSVIGAISLLFSLTSFFLWKENTGEGDISRATASLEEFLSENEAISVFFGWEEASENTE